MPEEIVVAEYPDEQRGVRTTLPPLPMVHKSTHSPMPEAMQGLMPSQAEIVRLEARAREHRLKMKRDA